MLIQLQERSISVPIVKLHTAVVGSGAAGFNAALRLRKYGVDSVGIITEGKKCGTSRNTGSDKQTYYKMNLSGLSPDSPGAMAKDLFSGCCVDGDIAYVEAALSVPCFLQLAELGVPFPVNRLGEYVGYQTDHDKSARATSAGPLTSKLMTQCLENAVEEAGVEIYDRCLVVQILRKENRAIGLLALELDKSTQSPHFLIVQCENIIYATGGPAGIYADTVYPVGHRGASGIAFEAGVWGRNLTEWQYGLASVKPRWNVSGTYMQVLPRFISVDAVGKEHEFLAEHYGRDLSYLSKVFRKGYEWPFDCRKAHHGSSEIDLLVYRESVLRRRRVYLDYRTNPEGYGELPFQNLDAEARQYLQKNNACFGTPVERLIHMNEPAYELYRSKGVDLKTERLEIVLCAQHNNGGLEIDCWWKTNLDHFFAVGEAAGSHGVYRPGGSALNAGQVGAMRAAQYIAYHKPDDAPVTMEIFADVAKEAVIQHHILCKNILSGGDNLSSFEMLIRKNMSDAAGAIRSTDKISAVKALHKEILEHFSERIRISSGRALQRAYQLRDALLAQQMYLTAMEDYSITVGGSRGSTIYVSPDRDSERDIGELFRFYLDNGKYNDQIQIVVYDRSNPKISWRTVRPLPYEDEAFETVWKQYRQTRNVE